MTVQLLYSRTLKDHAGRSMTVAADVFNSHCTGLLLRESNRAEPRNQFSRLITNRHDSNVSAFAKPLRRRDFTQIDFTALAPWKRLERMVEEWDALPDDWDADDGLAPKKSALGALRNFIDIAMKARVPAPRGYITSDGEIGLKWDAGERIATASFLSDGRFVAFSPRAKGGPVRVIGDYSSSSEALVFLQAVRALT